MSIDLPAGVSVTKDSSGEDTAYLINSKTLGFIGALVIRSTESGTHLDSFESDQETEEFVMDARREILKHVSDQFLKALS